MMPPHDTYIETHLGGGAIMQRKALALRNIGVDLNRRALERFRCDYAVELVHGCAREFLAGHEYQGRELNRDREALAGFPSHTTRHTGPYHGGSAWLNGKAGVQTW